MSTIAHRVMTKYKYSKEQKIKKKKVITTIINKNINNLDVKVKKTYFTVIKIYIDK